VQYAKENWGTWKVYDIWDRTKKNYLPQVEVKAFCSKTGLEYIHVLYEGPFVSWEHCRSFLHSNTYGDSQEGCFRSQTKVLMADGSSKRIKDVKVGDYVKSYNCKTKSVENRKVLNVWFNGNKPLDEWMTITVFPKGTSGHGNIGGQLVCTKNHGFFNGNGFSAASKIQSVYHFGKVLDHYRKQAFLGIMCSDGHYCRRDKSFKFSQKTENIEIFKMLFRDFLNPYVQESLSGKGSSISTLFFKRQLVWPFACDYITADNRFDYVKAFSDMDDIGWSYFFIGDGSYRANRSELIFGFESYSLNEYEIIKRAFCRNFNLSTCFDYVDKRVSAGCGKNIRIRNDTAKLVAVRMSKYIHAPFRYKLEYYKDFITEAEDFPAIEYGIVKRIPYTMIYTPPLSLAKTGHTTIGAWDLEIESTHTYFANGCLVHNCVVKNQTKLSDQEIRQPKYLKIVNEEFKESMKVREKKPIDPEKQKEFDNAKALISSVVTEARVNKAILKLIDSGELPAELTPKCMGAVMKRVPKMIWDDIIKEEIETVRAAGEDASRICSALTAEIARKLVLGR